MIALPFDSPAEFAEALYYAAESARLTLVVTPHDEPRTLQWDELSREDRIRWCRTVDRLLTVHGFSR